MTRVITLHPEFPEPDLITQAAGVILRGGLVAFPTETVYGLGANALDANAVARIFEAKGRPSNDPLIVHLASVDDLSRVASNIPSLAYQLAEAFFPGPLTLILPKQTIVPDNVTSGLGAVAVRVPSHPIAHELLRVSGVPIAAPSANHFGHTSPTTARHVLDDLDGRVDIILDGGPTSVGVESTVLDVTRAKPMILRPGGISRETIERLIGPVDLRPQKLPLSSESADSVPQISPGLLSKHYTPRAELILFLGEIDSALEKIYQQVQDQMSRKRSVGLLLSEGDLMRFTDIPCQKWSLGASDDLEQIARNLYAGMRMLDDMDVDIILTRHFGNRGLGLAIHDRLLRASSRIIE